MKEKRWIDSASACFQQHAGLYGWLLIITGILLLWGSIRKWEWLFQSDRRLWGIATFREIFGDVAAQTAFAIFAGIMMLIGIVWIIIYKNQ